jgi:hypothetical protein
LVVAIAVGLVTSMLFFNKHRVETDESVSLLKLDLLP